MRSQPFSRGVLAALFLCAFPAAVWGAQVRGKVVGPGDDPLPGVTLTLANDVTGSSRDTVSGADGTFFFYNVPDNPYHLRATLDGFGDFHADIEVRGAVPVEQTVRLTARFSGSTTVTAEKENVALETDDSSSHVDIDKSLVRRFAAPLASRAFEAIVLSSPGFSQDENGRYHFQGGHSQQLLVIDGQPIGDQVGITFSNSLNPAIAEGSRSSPAAWWGSTSSRRACRPSAFRSANPFALASPIPRSTIPPPTATTRTSRPTT